MIISNWVEKKLLGDGPRVKPKRRFKKGWEAEAWKTGFTQGWKEGFEEGRAYERKRIISQANSNG